MGGMGVGEEGEEGDWGWGMGKEERVGMRGGIVWGWWKGERG